MSFTLDVFTISFFLGTFFISFSSPTFIIYLSLCLILCLSLLFISLPRSLQTRSLSLFRHVNYPCLFLSLTLSLSPATLTHFTVFCFGRNLSVFLSPSISFFSHVNRHLSNMYTHYRSLSLSLSRCRFSSCSHARVPYSFMVWTPPLSFSISLSLSSHTHPFYYLLLWTPPPSLSLSLSLSLFSHTPHFTLFCWVYSLSVSIFSHVNLHSSDTYTTPISLSLSRSLALSLALSRSFSLSLSLYLSLSPATLTHFTICCCGRHLPPFLSHSRFLSSATLTHFTLFCWVYSLSVSIYSHVNRHSSDTYTTPISIYLSLSPANHDMSD